MEHYFQETYYNYETINSICTRCHDMVWYGNRYGPERGFPRCSKFKLRVNRVRFSLGLMFGLGLGLGLDKA